MKRNVFCLAAIILFLTAAESYADIESREKTVVVTASRIGQLGYKIAGNVTVITNDDIQASAAQSVPELLAETIGVTVQNLGSSKRTTVDIRGFGDTARSNVLVLVNDRRVNSISIEAPDLTQVPLDSIERIEIIRGGASVLYGDNAVGGVINIITKKGEGKFSGKVGGFYGSYDKQGTNVEFSGEENNISYYVHSQYFDERGYRYNSDVLSKDFNSRFGYNITDTFGVDLNLGWHEDSFGLPGGLSNAELNSLGRRGSPAESDAASSKDRYVNVGFNVIPWPEDEYYGEFIIDYYYRNKDVYSEFNEFAGFETHTKQNIDTSGITGKYVFDREVFDKEVSFVTGVDYYQHEEDILGDGSAFDTGDITITKDEIGAFGFLEFELLEDLFFNGGSRYQKAEYSFNQRDITNFDTDTAEEVINSGGLKYEYANGSNIHFNAQQTFRFLATDEWYSISSGVLNTDLEQQRGLQFEAGIKHNFNDKVVASVTPYYMMLKHEIFFNPLTFSNSNYPETERIGVEFGSEVDIMKFMDIDFLDALDFSTDFTWQRPQFSNGVNKGMDIPLVARYQAGSRLVAKFLDHYTFSLSGKYVGSRWAINDVSNGNLHGTTPIKPNYVLDSKVSYKDDRFEVYGAVNNITNEKYNSVEIKSTFSANKDHFPAAGTNYIAGVNVLF